ncbi:glycoside hydrolase family 3 N-terminal domain-containing protein [Gracilinema caldarium]|uniref:glycoside hydrolase family 3 N-terminal domain-containing protein n=1 Tax=Gracilinema caldarium TaxID=215591 RepID=UPI0026E9496B|nr:glycoside hydrolase family 3 N-terminal domain-containing protein [Gracilinema caldarium]
MKENTLVAPLLSLAHVKSLLIAAIIVMNLFVFAACKRPEHRNIDELKSRQKQYWETASRIAHSLSSEALAAQVLMTGVAGKEVLSSDMKKLLHEIPVGAIMLFRYNIADSPAAVHSFISECTENAALQLPVDAANKEVPAVNRLLPFVAIDHEGGDVYRLGQVATRLPPADRYLRNTSQTALPESAWLEIRQAAYLSGRELRALGITMNLAPVAEPLAPENAAFLKNRSFASDPKAAASAAAAFIQGMGEAGVTSVVKHFPASAAADPHHGRSVLDVDKKRLDYLVSPFSALLKTGSPILGQNSLYPASLLSLPIGAGAVMVAHTIIPSVQANIPASLSSSVMQDWIKKELGFQGIVIADDFTMKAITSLGFTPETAMIESLRSGADMIMVWPRDLGRFHRHLVQEAKTDTLFRERLIDAAGRIIYQKLIYSLVQGHPDGQDGLTAEPFNEEGYGCMRKATEQFLRERNLR